MRSLGVGDPLARAARVTLDGVEQTACTFASEHAGYVRRIAKRRGRWRIEYDRVVEEIVVGDVRIDFPSLTPEQVAPYDRCGGR